MVVDGQNADFFRHGLHLMQVLVISFIGVEDGFQHAGTPISFDPSTPSIILRPQKGIQIQQYARMATSSGSQRIAREPHFWGLPNSLALVSLLVCSDCSLCFLPAWWGSPSWC